MSDGISWGYWDVCRCGVKKKGWKVGIEDAEMMNASVACREEDGENDENETNARRDANAERAGREWGGGGDPHLDT